MPKKENSQKPAVSPFMNNEAAVREAESLAIGREEMEPLLVILRKNEKELLCYPGVWKVDIGFRWKDGKITGEVALRVHVTKKMLPEELKLKDTVPRELDGLHVDVLESKSEPAALQSNDALPQPRTARHDPLTGGVETCNPAVGRAGTLGAVVFDSTTGLPEALSTHGIFIGDRPHNAAGDSINQPSTTNEKDAIGKVVRSNRALDCAIAALKGHREIDKEIIGFPGGVKGLVPPRLGAVCAKSGRTTGNVGLGFVEGIGENEFCLVPLSAAVPAYKSNSPLSLPGDEGAIWLDQGHSAAGVHAANQAASGGCPERAWAMRADRVSAALHIDFCRRKAQPFLSPKGPALVSPGNCIIIGWVEPGTLQVNFMRSTDGLTFRERKKPTGFRASDAMALALFNDRLVAAYVDINRLLNVWLSDDGLTWRGGDRIRLDEVCLSVPSLAAFNDKLYLAWRGYGNRLKLRQSANATNWAHEITLPHEIITESGPAMASFNGRLRLGWRGSDNILNMASIDHTGEIFPHSGKRINGIITGSRPFLHVHGGKLYCAWQCLVVRSLNVMESANGTTFNNFIPIREKCTDGPALASLYNNLVWSWTGAGDDRAIHTLVCEIRNR